MSYSRAKRIEQWLMAADLAIVVAWSLVGYFLFPANLQTVQAWVMSAAWFFGQLMVGGHNPLYLHPRYRILISMALSLAFASLLGVFWAGSGWAWYMKGGLHSFIALAIAGTFTRLLLSFVLRQPAIQLVPCQLRKAFHPLLDEMAALPHVFIDRELASPADKLPERKPGYPNYLVAIDSRLYEGDFNELLPLYERVEVVDVCEFYETLLGKTAMIDTQKGWLLPLPLRTPSPIYEIIRRLRDVIVVLVTLPITLPVIALAALAIKLTSPGPIFFVQERLGRFGKLFRLVKLRTMVTTAERSGPQWAGARDPRVTPLGRFLRATGIDELPQLWNILNGEMSFVGPRPEQPAIAERLHSLIPFYNARLLVPPGLTGWAQLHQGGDTSDADVANKLRYDLYYLKNCNPFMDLRILLSTAQMLLHLAKPAPKKAPAVPAAR